MLRFLVSVVGPQHPWDLQVVAELGSCEALGGAESPAVSPSRWSFPKRVSFLAAKWASHCWGHVVPSQSLANRMRDTHPPLSQRHKMLQNGSQRQKMLKSFVNTQGLATSMWVASVFFIFPKYFTFTVLKTIFHHPKMSRNFTSLVPSPSSDREGCPLLVCTHSRASWNQTSSACSCLQRGGPERGSTCPGAHMPAHPPQPSTPA